MAGSNWSRSDCGAGDVLVAQKRRTLHLPVGARTGRNGVKLNNAEAANYDLKSAERAFLPSLLNLAILHADGRATSLDNRDGLKWMLIAQKAATQCPEAAVCKLVLEYKRGYRARLEANRSASERREARQLADTWQPVR